MKSKGYTKKQVGPVVGQVGQAVGQVVGQGRVALVLALPPSTNEIWRKSRNSVMKSEKARAYSGYVAAEWARQGAGWKVEQGPVTVRLEIYGPGRWDLDNKIKALLDALNGLAWEDDSQVVEIVARKHKTEAGGYRGVIVSLGRHLDEQSNCI